MRDLTIGRRRIGPRHPTFIIAEAGANWRISTDRKRNFRQALRLIDIAVRARADAVKFQLYRAAKLYTTNAGTADYLKKRKSIYRIIEEMELPYAWLPRLKRYCDRRGILFLCTPFDAEGVDQLDRVGIAAYKVASYSITHYPLLRSIAKKHKPVILSTGAADLAAVDRAVRLLRSNGNPPFALLQCTAKYPAPLTTLNLRVIPALIARYRVPVGLSDHSREPSIGPLGAVALGARLIEKHYTTDNALPGPDHGFAILPHELTDLVTNVRMLEAALGSETKDISSAERELHRFTAYRIFAIQDIEPGQRLAGRVELLRSGKVSRGLLADEWERVVERRARRFIAKHTPITNALLRKP